MIYRKQIIIQYRKCYTHIELHLLYSNPDLQIQTITITHDTHDTDANNNNDTGIS